VRSRGKEEERMEIVPGRVGDWVVVVVVPEVVTTVGVVVPCGEGIREVLRVRLAIERDAGLSPKREKSEKWVVVQVTV
jgi:hypothetical protein